MGRWGHGLFESDQDLDYVWDVEQKAGCKLLHPSRDRKMVAKRLNEGLGSSLIRRFIKSPPHVLFTILLMMRNGAYISYEMKAQFNDALSKTPVTNQMYEQIVIACRDYKNDGTPWDFGEKGLFETIENHITEGKTGLVNV